MRDLKSKAAVTLAKLHSRNLDVLRSLAVCLVLFDHVGKFCGLNSIAGCDLKHFGAWGVYLFFIHTSAVLTASLDRIGGALKTFYIQRAFRIYPLAIFCVLGVLILRIPAAHIAGPFHIVAAQSGPLEIAANLLLVQSFHGLHSIIGPLWTLPFEMQFYVVLPFAWRFIRRWPWAIGVLFAAACLIAPFTGRHPFFGPEIAAGMLLASLVQRRSIPGWIFGVLLLGSVVAYVASPHPLTAAVASIVLAAVVPHARELRIPVTEEIAKYSYGIYLLHMPCLWFAFELRAPRWVQGVAFAALLCGLSIAVYHGLENPLVKLGRKIARRAKPASVAPAIETAPRVEKINTEVSA